MKILHTVEAYYPSVGGMQEVVRQISERLVRRGHEVTVATSKVKDRREKVINGVNIAGFNISGNSVCGLKGDVSGYEDFLLSSSFDITTNFAAQQWATDVMLPLLDRIKSKKVFVPTGFSGLYLKGYSKYFESMKEWIKKYDMNVFLSNDYRDINFARNCGVKNMTVIPNGASEEEFLPETGIDIRAALGIPKEHSLILHVGSHTGIKGHAEAIKIFSKAQIRNATFLMVANDFEDGCGTACMLKKRLFSAMPRRRSDGKRLIVTSLPRNETVAAYKTADLFLFPSNVECSPLVLYECLASKTPFLTTDVGNASEIIEWSRGGLLLPTNINKEGYSIADIGGSAKSLAVIYNDAERRRQMVQAGFAAWQERFTWEKIAKTYEKHYIDIVRVKHHES